MVRSRGEAESRQLVHAARSERRQLRRAAVERRHDMSHERKIKLTNASNTVFQLGVDRQIRLMSLDDFGKIFGPAPQRLIADSHLKMVGFESINQITNRGPAMKKATGLTSIWSMGQFPPGDQTVIIVPYRPSTDATFGSIVKDDYFGPVPADRLKQVAALRCFSPMGNIARKSAPRKGGVMPLAASVDLQNNVLTLVSFDLPSHPETRLYLNNAWDLPQKDPFTGDVFNSYNDGPPAPGSRRWDHSMNWKASRRQRNSPRDSR